MGIKFYQCQYCGNIHKIDIRSKPRSDDIFVSLWCPKCQETTRQLDCGDKEGQIYELYNLNLDPRYY